MGYDVFLLFFCSVWCLEENHDPFFGDDQFGYCEDFSSGSHLIEMHALGNPCDCYLMCENLFNCCYFAFSLLDPDDIGFQTDCYLYSCDFSPTYYFPHEDSWEVQEEFLCYSLPDTYGRQNERK